MAYSELEGDSELDGDSEPEGHLVPEEQIILRFASAIAEKHRKLADYLNKGIVSRGEPYVIAIGTRAVPGSLFETDLPFVLQALYPVGPNSITIDVNTQEILNQGYAYRPEIRKLAGTSVSTTFFVDQAYSGISAVVSGNPDLYEMNSPFLRLFHNPKASAPLPLGWLSRVQEWWREGGEVKHRWVE